MSTNLFSPDNAVLVSQMALASSVVVVSLRLFLTAERRHELLNFFTHHLHDSKSEQAHKLYHKIHRRLPPFDSRPHPH
jgi:hypothetical protein